MAHGVVPPGSVLRGPGGFLSSAAQRSTGGGAGDDAAEERVSLLAGASGGGGGRNGGAAGSSSAAAAASLLPVAKAPLPPFDIAANGSSGGRGGGLFGGGGGGAGPSSSFEADEDAEEAEAAANAATAAAAGAAGAGGSAYESLDYEVVENVVWRGDAAARTHGDQMLRSATKWTLCFCLGVITAAAAFAVNLAVENLAGFKFWATLALLNRGHALLSFLAYAGINCLLVGGSAWLTVTHAPAAAGSGIAEVKAYLNGIDVPGIFLPKTLGVKLVGSVGAVAGGLAVGKEGPFVHAGACLGALLSQGGAGEPGRHVAWFRRVGFWNDRDRADLVACGAAAGVAAAFRAPVGGVLFALEEMTSWFRNQLLWHAFFTTAVVSVAVRTLMRICSEERGASQCGFFGAGGYLLYEISEAQEAFGPSELLPALLLGICGGLLGAWFVHLNAGLARWRRRVLARYGPRGRLVEAVAVALLTSALSFVLPAMTGCRPCPPDVGDVCPRPETAHSGNFVPFACGARAPGLAGLGSAFAAAAPSSSSSSSAANGGGIAGSSSGSSTNTRYNDLATILFNTQDDAIRNLFSSQTRHEYGVGALLAFAAVFFALAVLSYGLALPTGLFVPSILLGATYGRLVGVFAAGGGGGGSQHTVDEGTYALLGAASFLGGCMRMTVASCVMLLELTNNLALLPLMMLVTLVAKAVGDGTGVRAVYESLMALKRAPFLAPAPAPLMRHITAAERAGKPPVTFARVERVGRVLAALRETRHNGFVVMAAQGQGQGASGQGASPSPGRSGGGANGQSPSSNNNNNTNGQQQQGGGILGIVLRSQLVVLLRSRRCFQPTSFVSELAGRVAFSYQQSDFARPVSAPPPGMGDAAGGLLPALTPAEQDMFIDLAPYANPSYFVVQEDASLAKAYALFRALGLRHLAVIPRAAAVVGVLTRHDLLLGGGDDDRARGFDGGAGGLGGGGDDGLLLAAPRGAGAAGLASALRGTVRDALDAYESSAAAAAAAAARASGALAGTGGAPPPAPPPRLSTMPLAVATTAAATAAATPPRGAAPPGLKPMQPLQAAPLRSMSSGWGDDDDDDDGGGGVLANTAAANTPPLASSSAVAGAAARRRAP